ncbi:DNA mismatch repair protein mutL [Colletotrichum abscissum]|uniref:DNA mismatch repair protein mutL n=1 Tax=Colletotrichum abscissum TaxID=1671311 RepID=A0A9Q0ATV5_9PEZI|nr:DNA mismatch repair protein mutL [Colletotrichum abscissum]
MSISQLPQATVRQLGSSVVIPSPVSLVKELVDNAIDANANHIEIRTSANAIDKIQVRDNGHGISSEDYDALGRRSHTSKLRTFEELQCKGGQTLGFRGDALASVNAVSKLTITTRTTRDPVAVLLVLNPKGGGFTDKKHVAGSVGTTVDVSDLFANIPVRRQQILKESKKTYAQIKDLLQVYALTRPHIRLCLKVIKNDKLSWSYAPSKDGGVREAVLQVFGGTTPAILATKPGRPDTPASVMRLEAFLPRADADPLKVSGKGYFISVDSRPMATTGGTMKKLVDIYKKHLRGCVVLDNSSKSIPKPFIRLNVECRLGSYDPNVTTAKDEVIFANEPKLLSLFEDMCKEIYRATEPDITAEVVTESHQGAYERARHQSPDLLPDDDEENYDLLQELVSVDGKSQERVLTGLGSPESGQQLPEPPDREHSHGRKAVPGAVEDLSCPASVDHSSIDIEYSTVIDSSPSSDPGQARIGRGDEGDTQEAVLTQTLLRTGWEVNMAREETASPEGQTQLVLLGPPSTDVHEFIQSQMEQQTQREEPNPWSLARKAAANHSARREDISGLQYTGEHRDGDTTPRQQGHAPNLADTMQEADEVVSQEIEDREFSRQQKSQPHWVPAAAREGIYEPDTLKPPILQHPTAPPTSHQIPRHREQRRIPRDEEAFHSSFTGHEIEDLEIIPQRGPGVRQRIGAKTPYPFTDLDESSVLGTPPPSSSPLRKPFRVPARIEQGSNRHGRQAPLRPAQAARRFEPRRADGLRQSKLAVNTRRDIQHPELKDTSGYCFPSIESRRDNYNDDVEETRKSKHRYEQASPDPNERQMLERLNALRHRTEDVYVEIAGEERGRSLSRRATTTLPDMSPRRYLKKRLASRSRSRTKIHKRMRSEMLPFEKLFSEPHTQTHSLALDLQDLRQEVTNASDFDLYISRGIQEVAFHMGRNEMENISNKLQEIVCAWVYEKHGVEVELEVDIGALCDGEDIGV